jgi:hypothetical protein
VRHHAFPLGSENLQFPPQQLGLGNHLIPLYKQPQHRRSRRSQTDARQLVCLAQDYSQGIDQLHDSGGRQDGHATSSIKEWPYHPKVGTVTADRMHL